MTLKSLPTRVLATQLITAVLRDKQSLNPLLPIFKKKCQTDQDAAFMQAVVFGVLRWYPRLAFVANQFLDKPMKPKDIEIFYLVCVGLYQLMEMRVPEHAAISETVQASKIMNKPWAAGLINAVLRSYQREKDAINANCLLNEEAKFKHPAWIIHSIKTAYPNDWEAILKANSQQAPLTLRINLQKISRELYLEKLKAVNIIAHPLIHLDAALMLETAMEVTSLPGFEEGLFSVQDGAAQAVVKLLELSENLRVLDACAAPGGKATHCLEAEPNLSELVAVDISEQRVKIIQENLHRLQLSATLITGDASHPKTWWDGKEFDRILLDAPCSATGVIRRHPDILYLREPNDIPKLAAQQIQMLEALWPLLKPNGLLVYTTCSIFPEENEHVIQAFLKNHIDATILPIPLSNGSPKDIGHQVLPGQENWDGFYYAKIRKG